MRFAVLFASLLSATATLLPAMALAQTAPQPTPPAGQTTAKPAAPTTAKPAAASSSLTGTWTGRVQEVGRSDPFAITLTIDAKGATTTYPDQSCAGKLTRIGVSGGFAFYAEKITKGAYDKAKGTGCLDGTMVLTRAGNSVLMSWFGTVDNQPYHASATLTLASPKL
jgi:hypothetical protein